MLKATGDKIIFTSPVYFIRDSARETNRGDTAMTPPPIAIPEVFDEQVDHLLLVWRVLVPLQLHS